MYAGEMVSYKGPRLTAVVPTLSPVAGIGWDARSFGNPNGSMSYDSVGASSLRMTNKCEPFHEAAEAAAPVGMTNESRFALCESFSLFSRHTYETSSLSRKEQGVLPRFAYAHLVLGFLGAAGMAAHL
jgi:hypothetical protein